MTRTKIILIVSSLIFISLIAYLRSNYLYTPIVDDAYIFFRYAENIVNGHGFVWNIGEQPIEGYTSFLYLVVLIFAKFLSLDLELFSIIFGIITSTLTLYFSFLIYQHLHSNKNGAILENIITVILIALSPAFLYWSVAGMETSFYSMLLLLTIYSFLKFPDLSREISKGKVLKEDRNYLTGLTLFKGVLFGLLCVTRLEAVLFFLLALYYLMKQENSFIKIRINKSVVLFTLGFTIIFAAYFIWRWSYFGYFLPNTFYAKTGGGLQQITGGFLYVLKSLRLFYGLGWIPLVFVMFFFKKNMFTGKAGFVLSFALISLATTILIGGDHFNYGRFVLPVFPLLFVVFLPALNRMLSVQIKYLNIKPFYRVAAILIFLIITLIVKPVYKQVISGFQNLLESKKEILAVYDESTEEEIIDWQHGWVIMGKALKQIADKDDYIAAVPIGAIGYYSKVNIIDMVGIVDPVIAHEKFSSNLVKKWTPGHTKGNGKYILSRKPEYIQLTDYLTRSPLEKPHKRSMQFISVKEIWESEEFHHDYEFYPVEVIDGWYYNLFKRKSEG